MNIWKCILEILRFRFRFKSCRSEVNFDFNPDKVIDELEVTKEEVVQFKELLTKLQALEEAKKKKANGKFH